MKYEKVVDEILDQTDDPDQLHKAMDLVVGKVINQERIQIYKTLLIYFSELTDKNKAYLVEKIKNNQVVLDERIQKLADAGIFSNVNEFFDLEDGMEKIRIDKNLIRNYGTIEVDVQPNGLFRNYARAYTQVREVPTPMPPVDDAAITANLQRVYHAVVNEALTTTTPHNTGMAVDVAMDRGADLERRVTTILDTIQQNPDVDWVTLIENDETRRLARNAPIPNVPNPGPAAVTMTFDEDLGDDDYFEDEDDDGDIPF